MEKEQIQQKMKEKGLRITPQRYCVYANLLSRCDHPTVEQILTDVNQDLPIASKASVYSALTVLRKVGLVREVLLDEGVTRYDGRIESHHHFVCINCGSILDLEWENFKDLSMKNLPQGIKGNSYEITVKGICDRCN
jgi:Fur family transcriptional regulator, peroxide stress response regulator